MQKINVIPSNKDSFRSLLIFAEEILAICRKHDIAPIVYGSLAYFAHTKDEAMPVKDLDFLVSKAAFHNLISDLKKLSGVTFIEQPWDSVEVFKGDFKVDLDSIERFLDPRSHETTDVEVQGVQFAVLNKEALISIYQEALDNMPRLKKLEEKRQKYMKKLNALKSA